MNYIGLYSIPLMMYPNGFRTKVWEDQLKKNPKFLTNNFRAETQEDVKSLYVSLLEIETILFPHGALRKLTTRKPTKPGPRKPKYKWDKRYRNRRDKQYRMDQRKDKNAKNKREKRKREKGKRKKGKGGKRYTKEELKNMECHICGKHGHLKRYCNDKEKRNKYCKDNNCCRWCLRPNHQMKNCLQRKKYNERKGRNYYHGMEDVPDTYESESEENLEVQYLNFLFDLKSDPNIQIEETSIHEASSNDEVHTHKALKKNS